MLIRQLQYVLALASTRHFARAAALCQVSQPSLSTAIQSLERELGVVLVQRGQRFQGFTPDGQRLMPWIRRLVADWEALRSEAGHDGVALRGCLRLGVIPTALSLVPSLTATLQAEHPGVSVVVRSLATEAILRSLQECDIDCGIAYRQAQRSPKLRSLPLYVERYLLLCPDPHPFGSGASLSWAEAAALPLCLLTQNMQNRRNVDAVFAQHGLSPQVRLETDSMVALYCAVRSGGLSSIVPHSVFCAGGRQPGVASLALTPAVTSAVELVAPVRDPASALVERLWAIARASDLQRLLDGQAAPAVRAARPTRPARASRVVTRDRRGLSADRQTGLDRRARRP